MTFIKLKLLVAFMLIYSIDQICCKTGSSMLGRVSIRHKNITIDNENITSIFPKINKEYDDLTNKFNDLNNNSLNDFIEMSKKQIAVGVNNLEQILKKFSLEEQSKYEDLVEKNTNTFEVIMPLFSSCLKNYNLLGTAMRCIEQHQNKKNATENEFYQNFQNLLVTYNSILIPQINIIERKFITAVIVDISVIEIKNKEELLKEKSDIAISSPAQPIKDNSNMKHLFSNTSANNTLKNLYVDQKNILNTANSMNWIVIQSMSLNMTLNHIQKMNRVNHHEEKNAKCCFDYSQFQLDQAKNIAINDSNNCVEIGRLYLQDFVSLQIKEAKKYFPLCFYNNPRPEDMFGWMEFYQSFENAPNTLKTTYNEAVNKFIENQQFLLDKILNCSSKWRNYFDESLKHLTSQFDICIQNQKPYEKCIKPTRN